MTTVALQDLAHVLDAHMEEGQVTPAGRELVSVALGRVFPDRVHTVERCDAAECRELGCEECPSDTDWTAADGRLTAWLRDNPRPETPAPDGVIKERDGRRPDGHGLTLRALHAANIARQAEWCPDQVPDLSFRGNELAGEAGEACNVVKKLERERHGWRGSRATLDDLAQELADVVICADLCAVTAGVDLDAAVVAKFNATSAKQGLRTMLPAPTPDPTTGGEAPGGILSGQRNDPKAEPWHDEPWESLSYYRQHDVKRWYQNRDPQRRSIEGEPAERAARHKDRA